MKHHWHVSELLASGAVRNILNERPSQSGDRERAADRRRRALGAYERGELRFQCFDLGRQFDRWEQLGALGDNGRDGLRLLRREPAAPTSSSRSA